MSNKVGRLSLSWSLFRSCGHFFLNNKDLIILPLLALVFVILFLVFSFSGLIAVVAMNEHIAPWLSVIGGLLVYFITAFIALFFNASLVACVSARLAGDDCTVSAGMKLATQRWSKLLSWSIISSVVGIIINALERSHNIVQTIIALIIGFSWSLCALFVVPILVLENVGPIAALKKSAHLFGNKWRRVVGVQLFFVLIMLVVFAVAFLLVHLFAMMPVDLSTPTVILMAALVVGLFMISGTFSTIVNTALYLNLVNKVDVIGLDKRLLDQMLVRKKSSRWQDGAS